MVKKEFKRVYLIIRDDSYYKIYDNMKQLTDYEGLNYRTVQSYINKGIESIKKYNITIKRVDYVKYFYKKNDNFSNYQSYL